jgi:hypothetical protein
MRILWLVLVAAIVGRVQTAEACACCDATFSRAPIGWSAEGALLIDTADTHACEPKKRLEVWPVDAKEAAQCYDLFGDPEVEIACKDITSAWGKANAKKTSVAAKKKFAKAPTRLSGTKFRVKQSWADPEGDGSLNVVVELKTKTGWSSAWTGAIWPTTDQKKVKLDVSVWPDAKGERAALLIGYVMTGTGSRIVDVHWVTLLK